MANTNATCCCCFNLRSGTLTIGILLLIGHGLQAITSIINISNLAGNTQDDTLALSYYISLPISGIWVLFDALLIRGVTSGNPTLVFAWLCLAVPISVLATAGGAFLVYAASQYDDDAELYVVTASAVLVSSFLTWYWVFVVLQYYKVMKATRRQVAAARAPIMAHVQTSPSMYQQPTPAMGYQQPTATMSYEQGGQSPVRRY